MKRFVSLVVFALFVSASMSMALAAEKTKKVTFTRDILVNGTLVKKGDYKVSFNDETGEMAIISGKNTIAKTKASLENRTDKAYANEVSFTEQNNGNVLRSIRFAGESSAFSVNGETQTAAPQQ
jgi:hypothetical protein